LLKRLGEADTRGDIGLDFVEQSFREVGAA
jgi:hypothetical protein